MKPLQISWSFKLMDGIRVHEETKVHLLTYAEQTGQKPVKPFMLVIARDTAHATGLLTTIEGLFDGQYGQGNSGR